MNYERPELMEHLAREYALGTLKGPARRRFAVLMRDSRAIAAAVARWEERLAVMERAAAPVAPPVSTWRSIEERLFAHGAQVTQTRDAQPADRPPKASGAGFMSGLRQWLSGRAVGGVLAGLLVAVVVIKTTPDLVGLERASEALPASYVGVLAAPEQAPSVVVSSRRHGQLLTVKVLRPIAVPQGRKAMLWAIPKEGAPWAVGTVAPSGQTRIALPAPSEKLFTGVGRLAISFEAAGAGTGADAPVPPSAFALEGACVEVW